MDNQFIVKLIEILKLLPKETSKYSAYIHFADKLYFESICEILQ